MLQFPDLTSVETRVYRRCVAGACPQRHFFSTISITILAISPDR